MNQGGVPYAISNTPYSTPNWQGTPGNYSINFNKNVKGTVEHFDVYGEVRSRYSQVYWTRNNPIALPPALVERFKGKVMVITGYEIDQVTHADVPENSSTHGDVLGGFSCYPDCSASDKSIPIYHQYNHHYFSWLVNADAEVYHSDTPSLFPNPTYTAIRERAHNYNYPTNIVFKENPGGEFRKSYHGYPSGFGQFIFSPTQWIVEPMQVDTHNRNYGINDPVGYQPYFLPKMDDNNMTDLHSGLSPLIECPCTDRITRTLINTSAIIITGTCPAPIASAPACAAAVAALVPLASSATVHNPALPAGCSMSHSSSVAGAYDAIFNTAASSQTCGSAGQSSFSAQAFLAGLVNVSVSHDSHLATITLSGPAGVWFGVGFDASEMADQPYAVIVDGSGGVSERRLVEHGPGTLLTPSVAVVSSNVTGGVRTVVLTRAVQGASASYYSLPTTPGSINCIAAVGNTPQLAYHRARGAGQLVLLPTTGSMCVCTPVTQTFLTYMNSSTLPYDVYCAPEPRGDMLEHGDGTGRNVSNAACKMQTYNGGLHCCQNGYMLTDVEQEPLIPNATDTYFLKWRYYFQEYVPGTPTTPPSHKHLHHWVFLIDEAVNDYEEDNVQDAYGKPSIGRITAHITGAQMGIEDTPAVYNRFTPMVMTPHCHAPSCMREELWNADTGEIICNVTANYGSPQYGSLHDVFNEANYISIPPCLFGYQPGLQFPFNLTASTKLTAIKYFNNTFRHLGQMAQWTGLLAYDTDPY